MATNKINTRIVIRNDTYANWKTNNPVLLKGEVAIVTEARPTDNFNISDTFYIVVGNGVDAFTSLKPIYSNTIDKLVEEEGKSVFKQLKVVDTKSDLDSLTDAIKIGDIYKTNNDSKRYIALTARAAGSTDTITWYDLDEWITLGNTVKNQLTAFKTEIKADLAAETTRATTAETTLQTNLDSAKADLEAKIKEQVASVFRFKGTVADLTALKAIENPVIGDVYHVTENHTEYVYATVDGSETASWEELGSAELYTVKSDFEAAVERLDKADSTEKARAEAAEKTLTDAIAAETTRAKGAEQTLTDSIAAETTRAKAAEETLTNNLAAEITARTTADSTLSDRIAVLEASTTPVDGTTIVRNDTTSVISVGTISETNLDSALKTKINATVDTDDSLTIDTNNKLTVNEVSTDKFVQGTNTLVLDGGSSN